MYDVRTYEVLQCTVIQCGFMLRSLVGMSQVISFDLQYGNRTGGKNLIHKRSCEIPFLRYEYEYVVGQFDFRARNEIPPIIFELSAEQAKIGKDLFIEEINYLLSDTQTLTPCQFLLENIYNVVVE